MVKAEQKKRKAASLEELDGENQDEHHPDRVASVEVEPEGSENTAPVIVVPPIAATLSPIHKLIVVDLWSGDAKTVERALTKLANLCAPSHVTWKPENPADLHRAGAASAIVGAMNKWYTVPAIQAEGCTALGNPGHTSKDIRLSAKIAGGLEVIVCAMQNYSSNCQVQSMGCLALGNLCFNFKDHAAHVVNTMKGHELIIAAMKKYPDKARVQRWACHALAVLSDWKEFRTPLCDAGGRQALLDAIETHMDESQADVVYIQKRARLVLQRLLE
jgi:hypothetical protein